MGINFLIDNPKKNRRQMGGDDSSAAKFIQP